MQGFTVTLNSEEVIDKTTGQTLADYLGRGHVVDIIKEKSTFQFSSVETHVVGYDDKNNPIEKEVTGIRSIETVILKYLVLWEGNPEPKVHDSKAINWELTNDQYVSQHLSSDDEEEDEEPKRVVYYAHGGETEITEDKFTDLESFYTEYPQATFIGFIDEDEDTNEAEETTSTETETETETLTN